MTQFGLHTLPKVTTRGKKRVGRGYGSGKGGHTSGRGQKGQRSRRTIPWSFEGGALPLSQRLPFWRGKGRLNPLKPKPVPVNIGQLERFADGTVIDLAFLVKERIIHQSEADTRGVKILGDGKLTKKLTIVGMRTSQSARAAIEKSGGTITDKVTEALAVQTKNLESPAKEKDVVAPKKPEKSKHPKTASKLKVRMKKVATTEKYVKKITTTASKKTAVKKKIKR